MEVFIMYNAVGIDVSKGKSTITIIRPQGVVIRKPFDVSHSAKELRNLTDYIVSANQGGAISTNADLCIAT